MTPELVIARILTVVNITTPILLAATGELVVEKSGVLNLGVEGMMLCGAIAGFAVTFTCSDPEIADRHPWLVAAAPWLGVVAAAAAGALASLLFGFMALTLGANQVASGLALVIFGTGISSLIGTAFVGVAIQPFDQLFPDALAQASDLAASCSATAPWSISRFSWWRRSAGSSTAPAPGWCCARSARTTISAHSIGYSVIGVRYLAVMFGGAMAGIAGAYFSMVITPLWAER